MTKDTYIVRIRNGLKVVIPSQIARKYKIKDGDDVVFVEFGNYMLFIPRRDYENRLNPFISGHHNLGKINREEGKRIALEAARYLTRIINDEHTWFHTAHVAIVIDNSAIPILTKLDYETLEKYLNELADEGLILKNISGPSTSPVYRAKL
ncbi:MAG: AbrB/MazE/SpoVT family DNA-binding domain-containing protein [Candidatus Aenigmatarchaeota archaeon]